MLIWYQKKELKKENSFKDRMFDSQIKSIERNE